MLRRDPAQRLQPSPARAGPLPGVVPLRAFPRGDVQGGRPVAVRGRRAPPVTPDPELLLHLAMAGHAPGGF